MTTVSTIRTPTLSLASIRNGIPVTVILSTILACFCLVEASSDCFRPTLSCSNGPGCAMDDPDEVLKEVLGVVICAYECRLRGFCVSFNFLGTSRECLLFYTTPYKILTINNCTGYDKARGIETSGSNVSSGTQNLAKFRRSCQSTSYDTGKKILHSWLAVDDLLGFFPLKLQCSMTAVNQLNNWFMVDLMQFVSVGRVLILTPIVNGVRYQNLTIGVTNTSWAVKTPIKGKYPLCGVYFGPLPNATWMRVDCQPSVPPSRFVIVQQVSTSASSGVGMTLCELQVYSI